MRNKKDMSNLYNKNNKLMATHMTNSQLLKYVMKRLMPLSEK